MPKTEIANIIKANHINDANDAIDDLIGVECSVQLCEALKQAVEDWQNDPDKENKKPFDFLETKWQNIISNRYFIRWYSNKVAESYLQGTSITEIASVGLITTSNSDEKYKNAYKTAEERERSRLENQSKDRADRARDKFVIQFWNKNREAYDCVECLDKCNDHHDPHYDSHCDCNRHNCRICNRYDDTELGHNGIIIL